jgi:hypothetical protein
MQAFIVLGACAPVQAKRCHFDLHALSCVFRVFSTLAIPPPKGCCTSSKIAVFLLDEPMRFASLPAAYLKQFIKPVRTIQIRVHRWHYIGAAKKSLALPR